MENIYLIYGNENYLIKKKLDEIITKNNIEKDNIIRYNLDEVNVSEAIIEASTVSMFQTSKLIICEECKFLTGENKKEINHNIDMLLEYINHPFSDVYLVFIVEKEKLDDRKKIVKELKKLSKVVECKKIENYNLNSYLENYIKDKGYIITSKNINLIISIAGLDLANLINEIDKLLIYKDTDKNISEDDIKNLICVNIEDNIFALTNAIMNNQKEKIIKIYKDLISMGEDEIKLIATLANQFRLLLQVKLMKNNGYSDNEMISTLKEHPYRIKLAKNSLFDEDKLKDKILKLSELDYKIKSGNIDKNLGLELFLLDI